MKASKNYKNRDLISDSQIVGDASTDTKIHQLVDQAAKIRKSYRFTDTPTGNGARRTDLPVPRHFKAKHMPAPTNQKRGEQQ